MNEVAFWMSLLTLGVTVAGWFFTHSKQERLLNIQLEAEKSKAKYDLSAPRKISEVMKFLDWVENTGKDVVNIGTKMDMRSEHSGFEDAKYKELLDGYVAWTLQYTGFDSMATFNWDKYPLFVDNEKISKILNDLLNLYGDFINYGHKHFGKEVEQEAADAKFRNELFVSLIKKIKSLQNYGWGLIREIEAGN
jgi:hypothetical protein